MELAHRSTALTMKQQAECQLTELLDSFKDVFAFNMKEMTTIPGVEFEIPVSDEDTRVQTPVPFSSDRKRRSGTTGGGTTQEWSHQTIHVAMGFPHYHAP